MSKIRWSWDGLIFNMGISILVRRHLYIETAPWALFQYSRVPLSVWYKTKVVSHVLPKLAAISSQFHHLVKVALAAGSLVKWIPIKVTHNSKIDEIWVVCCSPIGIGSIQLQSPLTHCALWNFTSNGVEHLSKLIGAHTLKMISSLPWKLIFLKTYHNW